MTQLEQLAVTYVTYDMSAHTGHSLTRYAARLAAALEYSIRTTESPNISSVHRPLRPTRRTPINKAIAQAYGVAPRQRRVT